MKRILPRFSKILSKSLTFFLIVQLIAGIFLFLPKPQIAQAVVVTALTNVINTPTNTKVSVSTSHKIDFTTYTTVPVDGKIVITFPAGFNVSSAAFSAWSGFDGNKTVSTSSQTITITRTTDGTASTAGGKYITLSGITNTASVGTSYTVIVETQNSAATTLDGPTTSFYFSICANSCHTSTIDIPWMALASTSTKHTFKFTTATSTPADAKIKLTFPAGFDVSGATFSTSSDFDGGFNLSINSQTITVTRDNTGTSKAAGAKYIILNNIINSATESYYYPTIETTRADGTNIQGPSGVRMLIVDNAHGLAASAWPAPSYNMQATRKTNVAGPEYPTVKWASNLGQDLAHSSLNFYCVGQSGNIYAKIGDDAIDSSARSLALAINSNGDILWQKTTNTNDFCVASADGTVYFGGGFSWASGQWEARQESDGFLIAGGLAAWGSHIGLTPDGKVIIKGWTGGFGTNLFDIHGGFLAPIGGMGWDQKAQISVYSDNSTNIQQGAGESVCYPDGRSNYNFSFGTDIGVTPTIDENNLGYVFFGGANKNYIAFNGGSGSTLWTTSLPGTAPAGLPSAQDSSRIYTALSTNQLYALNKSDGSVLWALDSAVYAKSAPILDNNDTIYVSDPSKYLAAYSSNGNASPDFKWRYNSAVQAYVRNMYTGDLGPMIFDNNGNIITYDVTNKKAVSFQPWTIAGSVNSSGTYKAGDTITFTATSTMLATDPVSSTANQAQVYLDDGTIVPLAYSTTSGNYTIWTGTYLVPATVNIKDHTAIVEAAAVNVETDTTTHFASSPTNSNNTGITSTLTYSIGNVGGGTPTSFYAAAIAKKAAEQEAAKQVATSPGILPAPLSQGSLVKSPDSDKVYLITNNQRFWIPNAQAFTQAGYQWNNIQTITNTDLATKPTANLIKSANDPAVYALINNQRHHIPNPQIFTDYNYQWDNIITVSQSELNGYTPANLFKTINNPDVYYLENNQRHYIVSSQIFNQHNWQWNDIVKVSQSELDYYLEGDRVTE